ncbi:hypothetical protein [Ottowia oryzae]|uniref:hypothetical protein n=1 Tax=Ottowia oryzae TaxID=2109914 RepID=UPI000F50E8BE|nr:hypothetical protein [Ottowia oryzae]
MFKLSAGSLLKNIPLIFSAEETLLLDGIRHPAEMACYALHRLAGNLWKITAEGRLAEGDVESVFLDAWAVVDSIDRLRGLLGMVERRNPEWISGCQEFLQSTQTFRAMRNVTDHLGARIPYVVAKKGSALGVLKWLAVRNFSPDVPKNDWIISTCLILPGTLYQPNVQFLLSRDGEQIDNPVGKISLFAGEYECDLNDGVKKIVAVVESLELKLRAQLVGMDPDNLRCAKSDIYGKADLNAEVRDA